jgi:hypothetical protein
MNTNVRSGVRCSQVGWAEQPDNTAQRCTAILFGKWWPQIGPGEQEMRPAGMASIGVLGFISLSPTYQDR